MSQLGHAWAVVELISTSKSRKMGRRIRQRNIKSIMLPAVQQLISHYEGSYPLSTMGFDFLPDGIALVTGYALM